MRVDKPRGKAMSGLELVAFRLRLSNPTSDTKRCADTRKAKPANDNVEADDLHGKRWLDAGVARDHPQDSVQGGGGQIRPSVADQAEDAARQGVERNANDVLADPMYVCDDGTLPFPSGGVNFCSKFGDRPCSPSAPGASHRIV